MPSYVIVGASQGIGYQYIKTLASDPSNVIIGLARNPSAVQPKLASDGLDTNPNVHMLHGDLTSPASLKAAADKTSVILSTNNNNNNGAVDHLIINGVYGSPPTEFLTATDFGKDDTQEALFLNELQQSMTTNVAGVVWSINTFLPLVRRSAIKKVIVLSSAVADTDMYAVVGLRVGIPYAISKAGVNVVVAKFAVELRDEGIVFLALAPGMVKTDGPFRGALTGKNPEIGPEMLAQMMAGFGNVANYDPEWKGPIEPEESVELMLKVIGGAGMESSGGFVSQFGNKKWV